MTAKRLVVCAGAAALLAAPSGSASARTSEAARADTATSAPNVRRTVTAKVRRELLAAFRRENDDLAPETIHGPIWRRQCFTAVDGRRVCVRRPLNYSRFGKFEWVEASFWIDGEDPELQRGNFKRRVGDGWTARPRYSAPFPIPCAVLREWGRRC